LMIIRKGILNQKFVVGSFFGLPGCFSGFYFAFESGLQGPVFFNLENNGSIF